jgi:hypothetical protein
MNTDQWIRILAQGAGPAPRGVVPARIGTALAAGVAASAAACLLTLGLNPALATMGTGLAVKLAYVVGVLGASTWWLDRAARPAAGWHRAAGALLLVAALMAAWAGVVMGEAPAAARAALLLGQSWASCPWRVAALSLPAWLLAIWALRGLAPTRARLAGFAAGLVSGAVGALGYALFCPETSAAFVSIWYSLGMLVPAAVGALLGPCLLRW